MPFTILVLAALVAGCRGPDTPIETCTAENITPEAPLRVSSNFVDLYADADGFVCEGTGVLIDTQVGRIEQLLDVEVSRRIPMLLTQDVAPYCGMASGCTTFAGEVYAEPKSMMHEVAHGVACELRAYADPMWAEGVAEGWDWDPVYRQLGASDVLGGDPNEYSSADSAASAFLVRALHAEYGAEAIRDAYLQTSSDMGHAEAQAVFRDVFGLSIEAAEEEFAESAAAFHPFDDCGDPELEWDGLTLDYAAELDCGMASTYGPHREDPTAMYASVVSEVPADAKYRVMLEGFDTFLARRCMTHPVVDEADLPAEVDQGIAFDGGIVVLTEGRWRFDFLARHGDRLEGQAHFEWHDDP